MEITSEPAYVDVPIRQLEIGVHGDTREVTLYERDTLVFHKNGNIYVKILKAADLSTLEETTFLGPHIQWYTILYRVLRYPVKPAILDAKAEPVRETL